MLSGLGLLVLLKTTSFNQVVKVVQSCFSMQTLRQMERDEYNPFKLYAISLSIFFLFNFSFYIYKLNQVFKLVFVEQGALVQFSLILLITVSVFSIRNGASRMFTLFIDDHKLIPEYTYSSFMITQTLGLLLFPCMVLSELSPFNNLLFLSIATVIIITLQGFKWYRGLVFAFIDGKVGFLQIFTYFCSLEILPVLVLIKFIIEKY
ncbi:MAG TPA: DUF4271 domain-containing protein [Bacteroidia bacterium]|nr:DUF4271 domain-containing protein [Bacteroidia bacterium]